MAGRVNSVPAPLRRIARFWHRWQAFAAMKGQLVSYARGQQKNLSSAIACAMCVVAMKLLEPWPLKLIIDNVFLDHPLPDFIKPNLGFTENPSISLLLVLVACIVVIALTSGLFYFWQRIFAASAGLAITSEIRADLYAHIQSLSMRFHDHRRTGDLLMRLTSDVRVMREAFISLPIKFTEEFFLLTGMLALMLWMDWQLTLIALILLPFLVQLLRRYRRPMKKAVRKQREREGAMATMAAEVLGGIRVVQGFHREKDEYKKFGRANRKDLRAGLRTARLEGKLKWTVDTAVGVVTAAIIGFASLKVLNGELLPGDLIVFAIYLRGFYRPLRRMSRTLLRITRVTASGERISQILNQTPEVAEADDAKRAAKFKGKVVFENVDFSHLPEAATLHNLNLKISAGEHVVLVGATGAGKSSLVSLLPRFYDPDSGSVLIDGQDIRSYTLKSLREQISIVFQEPILFSTSIAENIAYGKRGTTTDEVFRAAEMSGIAAIVEALPEGYDTTVGERGGRLSGGQRQCVAIARAIIRNAPIVILDEPTTGLDPSARDMVLSALDQLKRNRTVITITHDMRTIKPGDRVIVLQDGKVAQDGHFEDVALIEPLLPDGRSPDLSKQS